MFTLEEKTSQNRGEPGACFFRKVSSHPRAFETGKHGKLLTGRVEMRALLVAFGRMQRKEWPGWR